MDKKSAYKFLSIGLGVDLDEKYSKQDITYIYQVKRDFLLKKIKRTLLPWRKAKRNESLKKLDTAYQVIMTDEKAANS